MRLEIVNQHSGFKVPRRFLTGWVTAVLKSLLKAKELSAKQKAFLKGDVELTLVFVSNPKMKKINSEFRGRNYATDVLSFAAGWGSSGGELVIAPDVIRKQAQEHGLGVNEELGYMVLHGILHLLGFDHETSARDEERMFALQDRIFDKLR